MDTILVTGGTGTIGRHVVRRLRNTGYDVRIFARRTSMHETGDGLILGDLLSNVRVDEAVDGVKSIIHCAGSRKGDEVATQNLIHAAVSAGRPHLVYISVVGADCIPISGRLDRMMFGYYEMKRKAEQLVAASGLPWTTIRATQVHDILFRVVETIVKLPVVPAPAGIAFQPVDSDEVAARLVELALGKPLGALPDIAGPRVYSMLELLRGYLERTNRRRLLLPLRLPGNAAHALRAGANLNSRRAIGMNLGGVPHRSVVAAPAGASASYVGVTASKAQVNHNRL